MAYYEGDPNNLNNQQDQNGQQFQQGPQGEQQQFQQDGPQQQYQQTSQGYNVVDAGQNPTKIMVFGIISCGLGSVFGWTIVCGIVSIVFGALAMSWSKSYMLANPVPSGQVRAGRITGIIGFVCGIVETVIGFIYWLVVGCAACVYM